MTPSRQPSLVLGPVLRRGGDSGFAAGGVAVWVETSTPCTVEVTVTPTEADGHQTFRSSTFMVAGHNFALVDITDLMPGRLIEYSVRLDDTTVWPDPDISAHVSRYEPWQTGTDLRISGGSCRQQAPQDTRDPSPQSTQGIRGWQGLSRRVSRGRGQAKGSPITAALGADALAAFANEVQQGRRPLPHVLLLTGDQVYADERHPTMTEELRERRGGPPRDGWPEVTSFEEYAWLYQRTWSHPLVRWLLSCVPSLMIFDDHDVIDDWNISDTWAAEIADEVWWQDRLNAALMSYWVYQHLGNLSTEARAADPLLRQITESPDGAEILREHARKTGSGIGRYATSWSYRVDLGPINLIVLDSRNGRVLEPDKRSMLQPRDWDLLETALADDPNVLIVTSVPWLLPPGVHNLERLVSMSVAGRWGHRIGRLGERIRRSIDLEHWAAFGRSVEDLTRHLDRSDSDRRVYPPVVFSGDVHFAFVAALRLATGCAYQVVSSPLRQGDAQYENAARRMAVSAAFDKAMRRLAGRGWRRQSPRSRHSMLDGFWTDNNIASLTYAPSGVTVQLDRSELTEDGLRLQNLLTRTLD